jgi:hypothetical protein
MEATSKLGAMEGRRDCGAALAALPCSIGARHGHGRSRWVRICRIRASGGVHSRRCLRAAWIDLGDSTCAVLGWAENVVFRGDERLKYDFVSAASNNELLELLKIRAPLSEVDNHRHQKGFVVLRRGTLSAE